MHAVFSDTEDTLPVKDGDLRVWWIAQIPTEPFHVPVNSLREADLLLHTLAAYDLFQLAHSIRPDFSNAGGVEIFQDGEWIDWYSDETGEDFYDYMSRTPKGGDS